jgi:hypothetical protein
MIFVFDLGAVGDHEADFAETADNVLGHLGQRVELAQGAPAAGQGEIGGFFGQNGLEFQIAAALGQRGFKLDLGGVDGLAGGGLLFFGQAPELLHQGGELAVGTQEIHARLLECRQIGGRAQLGERGLFESFDFVNELSHKRSSMSENEKTGEPSRLSPVSH